MMIVVQAYDLVTCRDTRKPDEWAARWLEASERGALPCNASIWIVPGTVGGEG
jgi:hypothetical protein